MTEKETWEAVWGDTPREEDSEKSSGCGGTVECAVCGKFHGWCDELTASKQVNEQIGEKMLPTGASTPQASNSGARRGSGVPFLSDADLSTTPREARILMVELKPKAKYGPAIHVKLAINGAIRIYSITITGQDGELSPNYKILVDKLGPEENDWIDKKFNVFLEQNKFNESYWKRISFSKK